ncbi:sulfotransferase [Pseudohongiella nitratireducens]|uniref:Sulfotransferase n=1 Tax=Pseudohongiella nitratireducens TaxID=1768907 RepID=A0A917GQH2_9GAMM|nr:sulfotransferase [Pseudohongiella nitratireducens]GGG53404.1 sulfotransferase [Pseudohongiella nitratireducens]
MSLAVHQMTGSRDAWMLARAQARAGNLPEALSLLTEVSRMEPENTEALSLACSLAAKLRNWSMMMQTAGAWTRSSPESVQAWQSLSHACFEQKQFVDAIAAFDVVISLDPENYRHRVSAARIATAAEQYDSARAHLAVATKISPESSDVLLASCRLNYLTGELEQAEEDCRKALKINPNLAPAYITLGQLRQGKLSTDEIGDLRRLLAVPRLHPEYKASLFFTLGDALDATRDVAGAFTAWQEANRVNLHISRQEGIRYNRARQEEETEIIRALFPDVKGNELAASPSKNCDKVQPIFVLGMPRSGTTLIESILASHSNVSGAGELPALPEIHDELIALARRIGAWEAREVISCKIDHWRERYLAALPDSGNGGWVVDKQPLNFRSIGLIRMLFPESPIIATQRDVLEVGLSIYRHDFSKNWPCAHRLEDIGHYMGVHHRIMQHWTQCNASNFLVVEHKKMITNPKKEISRLLDYSGLAEELACFEPHKTKRSISTFSAVQVRQPVSSAFSGRAQPYISYLEPLVTALQAAGIDMAPGHELETQRSERL